MAMELEFWLPDGPNGEHLDFAIQVRAWEIVPTVERYWRDNHAFVSLRNTSRQGEGWIIKVQRGYTSRTCPSVGKLQILSNEK